MGETTITKAQFAKRTILEVSSFITTIIVLIVDALLGYFTYRLINLGYIPLAIVFILIIALISFSFLIPKAHMFRWMAVGLAAWLLFSIFPILYTIYNAFTNYGDAHLITQTQAVAQIEAQTKANGVGQATNTGSKDKARYQCCHSQIFASVKDAIYSTDERIATQRR